MTTSRRNFLIGGAGVAAAAAASVPAMAATAEQASASTSASPVKKRHSTVTTKDGTVIYYDDWGSGPPVFFSHGWPLSVDAWEDQMFFLATNGARYIRNYGTKRVAKAVLVAAVPPLMLKTPANPGGTPISVFDGLRASVHADRSLFWFNLALPFYGYNRPGANVSQGVIQSFWLQGQMAGFPGAYFCIKAFSETDQTEDLKQFDKPTLIIQGTDDQIVPYTDASLRQHELIKGSILKLYQGAPHGLPTTLKDRLNQDLLEFCKA